MLLLLCSYMATEFGALVVEGHVAASCYNKRDCSYKSCYLRCVQCREDFPMSRCYFPSTIVHECHFHPLSLVPRLVENDQTYCDVCEAKRKEDECIYYCSQCKFEAHIRCVISKVSSPSYNELEDVKFVTLEEIEEEEVQVKKKETNGRDIYVLEDELQYSYVGLDKEVDAILHIASTMTWEDLMGTSVSYSYNFLHKALYSDESFEHFVNGLNSASTLTRMKSILRSVRKDRVVRVGEYLVPSEFEAVVETLFAKYGDFGVGYTCSEGMKHCIFVGVCKALGSMCNTKVVRTTEDLLIEWWTWFVMGKAVGFKIQFAIESLRRVVYAHFGLEADKYADGKLTRVRGKIQLPENIKELRRKLEEAERELEAAKIEEKELREAAFRVKKSPLMRKCLQEAQDLACYTAGETFLPPDPVE